MGQEDCVKLAVFVSGSGTDLQSIINAINAEKLNARIVLVVASKVGIGAIDRAIKANIPYATYLKDEYDSVEAMYDAMTEELERREVDYIVLAGYLTILTPNIIQKYEKRIINIHPSLLPKFGGQGMYGIHVHEAVLEAGETESGATVHYVDEGTDTGEIIAQVRVPVHEGDTPTALQRRVLAAEHELLPDTLAKLFNKSK